MRGVIGNSKSEGKKAKGGEGVSTKRKHLRVSERSGQDDGVGKHCPCVLSQPYQNYNQTTEQPSLRIP